MGIYSPMFCVAGSKGVKWEILMLHVKKSEAFQWSKTTETCFSLLYQPSAMFLVSTCFLPHEDSGTCAPSISQTCHACGLKVPCTQQQREGENMEKTHPLPRSPLPEATRIASIHIPLARINHMGTCGYKKRQGNVTLGPVGTATIPH